MFKKLSLVIVAIVLLLTASVKGQATYEINILNVTGLAGQPVELEVEVNNSGTFTGFQFDIILPTGFAYVNGSAVLTSRSNGHTVLASLFDGGTRLRIGSFAIPTRPFLGNSGTVVKFSFTTPSTPGVTPVNFVESIDSPIISNSGINVTTGWAGGTITLCGALSANLASSNVTCNGADDGIITISNPAGATNYEYSINGGTGWQTGGSFTGLVPGVYDVRMRDADVTACEVTLDGALTITEPGLLTVSILADQVICANSAPSPLTSTVGGGTLAYTYQWQYWDGDSWEDILNENNSTYSPGILTATTQYRLEVDDANGCGPLASNPVTITVLSTGTWTGAVSEDWFDAANWCGGVPDATIDVLIRPIPIVPRNPVINWPGGAVPQARAKNIVIQNGAKLVVQGTSKLTVSGDWVNQNNPAAHPGLGFNPGQGEVRFNGAGPRVIQNGGWPDSFFDVYFECPAGMTLSGPTTLFAHHLTVESGSLNAGTTDLEVSGDWTNNSGSTAFNPNGQGVTFKRKGDDMLAKVIGGDELTSFFDVFLDNVDHISLGNDITVTHMLNFTNGKIVLGANDLIMGPLAEITGAGDTKYAVTDGAGALQQNVAELETAVYPIGLASSYLPAMVQFMAGSVPDDLKARVASGLNTKYDIDDQPIGDPITNEVVGRVWFLEESTPGGSDAMVTLQWNLADEAPDFNRLLCDVGHYTGGTTGSWSWGAPAPASGPGPFTQSRAGITEFSPFAVAGQNITCSPGTGPWCAGSPVTVTYNAYGGTWTAPNNFFVELSDASGFGCQRQLARQLYWQPEHCNRSGAPDRIDTRRDTARYADRYGISYPDRQR